MNKTWKTIVNSFLVFGLTGILMFAAGCSDDDDTPAPQSTTSSGLVTSDATTGTVTAGTTVAAPVGVTSMTFNSASVFTDSLGAPVTGAITTTVTRSTSAVSLPAAAPNGTSLAVLLNIDMSKGATKVTNLSTPMTVIVAVPAGVTSVDVYSYNGTIWVLEQAGVAVVAGNATFNVTHLSIWACFSTISPLTVATASPLPAVTVNTAYTQTLAASGGTAPYTWTVTAGSALPTGLTLSSAGVISGTPTVEGTFTTSITVTDAPQRTAVKVFSLTVNPVGTALTITSTSPLAAGTVATAYGPVTLTATGGTAPYSWTVAAGSALPAGLNLTTAGVISGTPSAAGTFTTNITVTDAATATSTTAFSITVSAAAVNAAVLYQNSCAGCHSLGTVDTTGSPNLSQTTGMPSRFPTPGVAGHQGRTLSAAEITALTAYFQAN